jgi:squalene synthase HpnC
MKSLNSDIVIAGYKEARKLVRYHYENFPVLSVFIPPGVRNDVAIIYWFARTADDIADEGNVSAAVRLENLQAFEERLTSSLDGNPNNNLEAALHQTIKKKNLNPGNFFDLLKAFRQDITKKRYADFDEVLGYCSCSANPVGRILLELFNIRIDKAICYSDKICTALQITNFIQDTMTDFNRGRIYYPLDEMEKFGVNEKMFEMREINLNLKQLVEFSVGRVQSFFNEGRQLTEFLSGRFKYEIGWTINGGMEILNKIRGSDFDVLTTSPVLTKTDKLKLLFKSLFHL